MGEMPLIVAGELQTTQIFQNLIRNARKFYGEEAPRNDEFNKEISLRDSQIAPKR